MSEARNELPPLARSDSQTIRVIDGKECAATSFVHRSEAVARFAPAHGLVIPKLAHLMRSRTTINATRAGIGATTTLTRDTKRACGDNQRPRKRWSLPKAPKEGAVLVPDVSSSTQSSHRSSVDIYALDVDVTTSPLTHAALLRHNTTTLGLAPLRPDHMERRAKLVQKSTFELIAQASAVEF